MHALRSARHLARCVLAWFVVSLATAVAAPALQPQAAMERVCSAGGAMRWAPVPQAQADVQAAADWAAVRAALHHALDCPLCLSSAPPAASPPSFLPHTAAAEFTGPAPRAQPPRRLAGAPFPPRAPPVRA